MNPIAIVGISCRFPGANSPAEFWRLLCQSRDAIGDIPPERWNAADFHDADPTSAGKMYVRQGGFLDQVDAFDPQAFGISPREARRMDPQQRLMLELAWESLEDAGLPADQLAGKPVGVFVGFGVVENLLSQLREPATMDEYTITGNVPCVIANRISYVFDFRGPSMAVDTACSSSLVAVHQACRSLASGECDVALAGGVSLMLSPEMTVGFSRVRALSPDGRSKSFDASANGYARGEGGGLVVLKRLSDAVAAGDHIYAVIRGTAVNQDGRTNGLTAPNRFSQEAVLRAAYAEAGVDPASVQYIEAHGTGTLLGDPIEAKALGTVVGAGRPEAEPCLIGSVKSNIGHLEAAAGIAGLIKTALAIELRAIPASLHFHTPNPHIPFDKLRLKVAQQLTDWPAADLARAGVSAFGFGGTNAHAVVEAPASADNSPAAAVERPHVLLLSARSEAALAALALKYCHYLCDDDAGRRLPLSAICHTAATRRMQHGFRLAVVGRSHVELADSLAAFSCGQVGEHSFQGRVPPAGAQQSEVILPSAEDSDAEGAQKLAALAQQWACGAAINWQGVFATLGVTNNRPVALPTYPFQRQQMPRTRPTQPVSIDMKAKKQLSVRRIPAAIPIFAADRSAASHSFLLDHVIGGTPILPAAAMVEVALSAGREHSPGQPLAIRDLAIEQALPLVANAAGNLQLTIDNATTMTFGIHASSGDAEHWKSYARGRFVPLPTDEQRQPADAPALIAERLAGELLPSQLYARLAELGLQYGPAFRGVERIWHCGCEALGQVALARQLRNSDLDWALHPALLDCSMQVAAAALPTEPNFAGKLLVPVRFGQVRVFGPIPDRAWSHVRVTADAASGQPGIDVRILDEDGRVLAELLDVCLQSLAARDASPQENAATDSGTPLPSLAALSPLTADDRRTLLEPFLAGRIARELEIDASQLDRQEPLGNLGLDSLLVFKLAAQLHAELDLPISLSDLADGPSIAEYTVRLLARIPEASIAN